VFKVTIAQFGQFKEFHTPAEDIAVLSRLVLTSKRRYQKRLLVGCLTGRKEFTPSSKEPRLEIDRSYEGA